MDPTMDDRLAPPPQPNGAEERPTATRAARRRVPELIRVIRSDATLLVRQEIELGKQEMRQIAGEKAAGGGLLLGAAILGLFVIGFLGLAGAAALDLVLPRWAALLIVGGVFLLIAVIMVAVGRRAMAAPATPERTKQRMKEDVEWAKRRLKR